MGWGVASSSTGQYARGLLWSWDGTRNIWTHSGLKGITGIHPKVADSNKAKKLGDFKFQTRNKLQGHQPSLAVITCVTKVPVLGSFWSMHHKNSDENVNIWKEEMKTHLSGFDVENLDSSCCRWSHFMSIIFYHFFIFLFFLWDYYLLQQASRFWQDPCLTLPNIGHIPFFSHYQFRKYCRPWYFAQKTSVPAF